VELTARLLCEDRIRSLRDALELRTRTPDVVDAELHVAELHAHVVLVRPELYRTLERRTRACHIARVLGAVAGVEVRPRGIGVDLRYA
jgi:hypothetical protein